MILKRPKIKALTLASLVGVVCACASGASVADDTNYSSTLYGPLGLNTVPSARMDKAGTVRIGVGTLDPYAHGFIGFQIADPLYINIRQTAEISNINEDADRLYPGVDLKLRLTKETQWRPEIAVGLQSAPGHKRTSGEYLALSKRWKDFDFTAGLGWGRFGSAGHFDNPLKSLYEHFGKRRNIDGEMPSEPSNWFTGEKVGIFGGIEHFTPIEGLSIKMDYGADRYSAEEAAFGYDAPPAWAVGLNYKPRPWVDMSVGIQGTERLMGRISFNGMIDQWRDQSKSVVYKKPMRAHRTDMANTKQMELSAQQEDILLQHTAADMHSVQTRLRLAPGISAPRQLGRAVVHMSNHAGPDIEKLTITPSILGLQGPSVKLMRKDFEHAMGRNRGSPEEIWHNAEFDLEKKEALTRLDRGREHLFNLESYEFVLDNQLSLSEEDSGHLYRSSFLVKKRATDFFGILDTGASLRLNLHDNLDRINDVRPPAVLPVRSDVDQFADTRLSLDTLYTSFTHSFRPDLHLALLGGYLEEMYLGYGGELLYRPFGSRFALGAEAWQSFKREPDSDLHLSIGNDHVVSAYVNAWYDIPQHDLTFKAKIGRYLAEDIGGTLSLQKNFKNGARLEGYVTTTDSADFDLFGGVTHVDHGIRLSLPLGGFKHMPRNSEVKFKLAPFGRDIGQSVDNPLPLYELTEPFSYEHMIQYWDEIVE